MKTTAFKSERAAMMAHDVAKKARDEAFAKMETIYNAAK
jgi:hypothetical protein